MEKSAEFEINLKTQYFFKTLPNDLNDTSQHSVLTDFVVLTRPGSLCDIVVVVPAALEVAVALVSSVRRHENQE